MWCDLFGVFCAHMPHASRAAHEITLGIEQFGLLVAVLAGGVAILWGQR